MNARIKELAKEARLLTGWPVGEVEYQKFAELIIQAIYDEVKEELVDDDLIDAELDIEDRCYLRGNNGGIVDALCIIKNFNQEVEE